MYPRQSVCQADSADYFLFAVFQAGLTFAGWLLGYSVSDYISKVDHWVAFVLLGYIGVKMIIEGCSKKEEEVSGTSLLNTRQLVLLSVATSIDAVAVGISLAMIKLSFLKIGITTAMVLACTALASLTGLLGGAPRSRHRQEVRSPRRPHPYRHRSENSHRAPVCVNPAA